MKDNPLVSVLMTAYNREKYIAEAIESVLSQTFSNWELIIVDDGSKDSTVAIARSFEKVDNRIKVYVNKKNLGDYPNRNKAVSYSKGELLVFVDSDDTIYQDALEYVIEAFREFPSANYATIVDSFDGSAKAPKLITSESAIQDHFFRKSFLHRGPGGTVVRRTFFPALGGFPECYGPANDMYYNIKAASNSPVLLLPYHFLFYREHDGQEIKNRFAYVYQGYLYFNDIMKLPELPLSPEQREILKVKNKRRFIVNLSKYILKTRDFKKGFEAIKKADFRFTDFFQGLIH